MLPSPDDLALTHSQPLTRVVEVVEHPHVVTSVDRYGFHELVVARVASVNEGYRLHTLPAIRICRHGSRLERVCRAANNLRSSQVEKEAAALMLATKITGALL